MKRKNSFGRHRLTPYLLLLPSLLLFAMFTFWPFLKTIILSFSYTDKKGNFVKWAGIGNYLRVATSSTFAKTMTNTLVFALLVGVSTLLVAILLALLSASREKGSRLYEVMYSLPMAVASAPVAHHAGRRFGSDRQKTRYPTHQYLACKIGAHFSKFPLYKVKTSGLAGGLDFV